MLHQQEPPPYCSSVYSDYYLMVFQSNPQRGPTIILGINNFTITYNLNNLVSIALLDCTSAFHKLESCGLALWHPTLVLSLSYFPLRTLHQRVLSFLTKFQPILARQTLFISINSLIPYPHPHLFGNCYSASLLIIVAINVTLDKIPLTLLNCFKEALRQPIFIME